MSSVLAPLVAIPAGSIELRDARSGSSREVALHAFEIGRTPMRSSGPDARRIGS